MHVRHENNRRLKSHSYQNQLLVCRSALHRISIRRRHIERRYAALYLVNSDTFYESFYVRVPFTAHVTNQEVRLRSTQPPVSQTVMLTRLRFFGHVIRSDPDKDHTRALNAGVNRVATRPFLPGRPVFQPACPASRWNVCRDAICPVF